MTPLILTFLALLNTLTPQEVRDGWILLFDGKTLSGWDDPARKSPPGDSWSVEDGTIHGKSHPKVREDLLTNRTFNNFELVFEWKIPKGANSGVKYRIQDRVLLVGGKLNPASKRFEDTVDYEYEHRLGRRDAIQPGEHVEDYPIAFEYQVIDNQGHLDARRGPKYSAGSLYSLIGPTEQTAKPVGDWNTGRIVLRGNHVEHWLNGVKVVDTNLDSAEIAESLAKRWGTESPVYRLLTTQPKKSCPVGLQNHNDEVWFRSLKIRPLE
jgi:hypothetical protein